MKKIRQKFLRDRLVRILIQQKELHLLNPNSPNGLTVTQLRDRLIESGFNNFSGGRQIASLLRTTPGFSVISQIIPSNDTSFGARSVWTVNESEYFSWVADF